MTSETPNLDKFETAVKLFWMLVFALLPLWIIIADNLMHPNG